MALVVLVIVDSLTKKVTQNTVQEKAKVTPTLFENKDPYSFEMGTANDNNLHAEKITETIKNLSSSNLFPRAKFEKWYGFAEIQVPVARNKYFFKTNYSIDDVRPLANTLSASGKIKKYGNTVLASTIGEKGQLGAMLFFETNTGYFHFTAYPGVDMPDKDLDIDARIYALLKKLDIYDQSMQITAAYKKKSFEGSKFYEIKRNWALIGLPIYNPVGLLNIRENTKISELGFNSNSTLSNINDDISETSDLTEGIERRADFNTITIQISEKNNKVISIISNIRKIASKSEDALIVPYKEAISILQNDDSQFILASPGGEGKEVPWEKIYPNQMAEAEIAEVTESALAYLENSPGISQSTLEPFYIFRGKANLKSGYLTDFIAIQPATKQPLKNTGILPFRLIPQVQAQDTTQKQGAIDLITATPNLTPTPVVNFALPNCFPLATELNPSYELRSYSPPNNGISQNVTFGFSHKALINGQVTYSRKGWWYMIPAPNSDVNILRYDVDKVLLAIKSITGRRDFRAFLNVLGQGIYPDFQITGASCPIRITGESPTIFIYAPTGSILDIFPPNSIIYADPPTTASAKWRVKMQADGTFLVNDTNTRSYLYYEYPSSIKLQRPNFGWNIDKNNIEGFAKQTLAKLFGFSKNETERLIFELNHASSSVDKDKIFVGIINDEEIKNRLNLKISSENGGFVVNRIHLYVGKLNEEPVMPPAIKPIVRHEKLVLEIGAWSEND